MYEWLVGGASVFGLSGSNEPSIRPEAVGSRGEIARVTMQGPEMNECLVHRRNITVCTNDHERVYEMENTERQVTYYGPIAFPVLSLFFR